MKLLDVSVSFPLKFVGNILFNFALISKTDLLSFYVFESLIVIMLPNIGPGMFVVTLKSCQCLNITQVVLDSTL